ncbi:MAG: hypothetical protein FJ213_05940 [Ignavibacteria bacterium]|nr:hypothetical protein [Ignavibacteria bacterium]
MVNINLKSSIFITILTALLFFPIYVSAQEYLIENLTWLTGSWKSQTEPQSVEEFWIEPRNGIMLGVNRTISKSGKVFFEYLRIVERDKKLFYIASPGGKKETEFEMVEIKNGEVIFENPEHDFPQVIKYKLDKSKVLIAEVTGILNGKTNSLTWKFEREKK